MTDAQESADRLAERATRAEEAAFGAYDRFAGGQPLLVGHHSYRSAVRDRDRADNATRRAIELRQQADRAQAKADRVARQDALAAKASVSRSWRRDDFRPGDYVTCRVGPAGYKVEEVGRVKRVNAKSLTLDGGGGGWNDPKRRYDQVLSRIRDGVTATDPCEQLTQSEVFTADGVS